MKFLATEAKISRTSFLLKISHANSFGIIRVPALAPDSGVRAQGTVDKNIRAHRCALMAFSITIFASWQDLADAAL